MTSPQHFPILSDLIDASAIPGEFGALEDLGNQAIDLVLGQLRYSNLIREKSPDGAAASYNLTLKARELKLPFTGSGLAIVFFPGANNNSDFAVNFDWRWPIQRYFKGFEAQGFSYAPEALIDILLDLANIEDEKAFLAAIAEIFLSSGTAPYETFVTALVADIAQIKSEFPDVVVAVDNILDQIIIVKNEAAAILADPNIGLIDLIRSYDDYPNIVAAIDSAKSSFEDIQESVPTNFSPYTAVIKIFLNDISDLDEKSDKLIELFQTWLGKITREDIEDLLIPKFAIALNEIAMAIEVPRQILVPLDGNNEPIADETINTRLTFTTAGVGYDSRSGFDISIGAGPTAKLTKSILPGFGLTLDFDDIKIDLRRDSNIAEADAEGRPLDFMGVYVGNAVVGLPDKWFSGQTSTLGIVGRNMLIGTGGLSGTIGLEAISQSGKPLPVKTNAPANAELEFTLGKGGKGFKIGFNQFLMKWQQNTLIESDVKGSITIPNFKNCDDNGVPASGPLKIGIAAHFEQDGDFEITAKPTTDLRFCLEKAMIIKVNDLRVGKQDDLVYVSTSGELSFANNDILKSILKDPIVIKKLKIYSDGSFDIEGGSIPLPKGARLKLGPTEVYITNLTLGSGEREHSSTLRKYQYFGFSCGLSAGSAGLDLRGDGIEFWFTVDGGQFHSFLRIAGIGIDLIIPGSATPENAAVIIKGYLSLKEEEYLGSIEIKLPKVKIAGGAAMRMRPKVPAWIIDAYLELSAPIPLGALPLGIYGFRGMFGYRYIASKAAAGLNEDDSWVDYYVADKPPGGKGVHVGKMLSPAATHGVKAPVSIGAGLSLATSADSGFTFSIQAFLLISLPELIMIQGKANILGTRVGLTGGEPPFFAMVAFSPGHSIEFGLGVDYKLRDDGQLLDLYAEVRAAYYFQDSSAWFVHFGTKDKPITARILALFNGYSYLEISARGIEAGAGVTFGFAKKYGPVSAKVGAYFDIWGYLSFQGVQIGAGLALGGQVDVSIWGIGFGISIATMLEGTVPRPFRIAGSVEVCVYVKVLVKKFEKCFDVEFVWERNNDHEVAPISPMPLLAAGGQSTEVPVSAYHLGSGRTYGIDYFGTSPPEISLISATIPLDSYVDFQSKKAFDPNLVASKLSGVTNAPRGNRDVVPPKPSYNDVEHSYKIHDIAIEVYVPSDNAWKPYHPYEALTVGSSIASSSVNPSDLKIGSFQKSDLVYNKIRLLAQTPFSYMETSTGGYIPEQMGLTSSTLFCQETLRKRNCVTWNEPLTYMADGWYYHDGITILPFAKDSKVLTFANIFDIPKSLYIESGGSIEILLPKSAVEITLKLFSFAKSMTISYHSVKRGTSGIQTDQIASFEKTASDLLQPIFYTNYTMPIDKIVLTPAAAAGAAILILEQQIDKLKEQIYGRRKGAVANAASGGNDLKVKLTKLSTELTELKSVGCHFAPGPKGSPPEFTEVAITKLTVELKQCLLEVKRLEDQINKNCGGTELSVNCLSDLLSDGCVERQLTCLEKLNYDQKFRSRGSNEAVALISSLIKEQRGCIARVDAKLEKLQAMLKAEQAVNLAECVEAKRRLEELKNDCLFIEHTINDIEAGKAEYEKPKDVVDCGTYLHEMCWLTEEAHIFNQTIPSQAAIEGDYSLIKAASEQVIAPIWRPESTYRVRLTVSDSVDGASDAIFSVYAGFKTFGPIGHYPEEAIAKVSALAPISASANYDERLEVPETSLKYYIDEQRSYPYGGLIGQKPLYYDNPKLQLFFTKPYVYHFFSSWPAYQGLAALTGSMEIMIKDPTEGRAIVITVPEATTVLSTLPASSLSWEVDPDPIVPEDIRVYNNLRHPKLLNENFPGAQCWADDGVPIKPASKFIGCEVANLKPLKLYTAVVKSHFGNAVKDVHSYVFQTSRFASFEEHINSYRLRDKEGNLTVDAVFDLEVALDQGGAQIADNLDLALDIIVGNSSAQNQTLTATYSDPYQRLIEGHLALEALSPPIGLEFNFLKEPGTGDVFALLIQSVEPINDPRIPLIDLLSSVSVFENGQLSSGYLKLFSKDCSRVILMNLSKSIKSNDLKVRFGQLAWDGRKYFEKTSVLTGNLRG